jgi:hypothetical protein
VQLIRVADVRPGVRDDLLDGVLIERADLGEHCLRQRPAKLHGPRPPFFQRRVIEIGVRIRVQNFVRELRWHRRVDRDALDAPIGDARQDLD